MVRGIGLLPCLQAPIYAGLRQVLQTRMYKASPGVSLSMSKHHRILNMVRYDENAVDSTPGRD